MTRVRFERLKDGRIPGVLARRLLDALVERPGQTVSPEQLAPKLWPDGRPRHWRACLADQAKNLDTILGGGVVLRIGSPRRLDGFRLVVKRLPGGHLTSRPRPAQRRWPWSAQEDAYLRQHAGHVLLTGLVAGVNAIHGHERRPSGVAGRLYLLGLSKRVRAYSANQLAPLLGVNNGRITRWIERGMLRARRTEPDGLKPDGLKPDSRRAGWWLIEPADVEAFIRRYSHELDWRAMQPEHPLALLARTVQRADPYLTLAEAARRVGCSESALWQRLVRGQLGDYVRVTPSKRTADAARGTIRIRLSDLEGLRVRMPKGPRPHATAIQVS